MNAERNGGHRLQQGNESSRSHCTRPNLANVGPVECLGNISEGSGLGDPTETGFILSRVQEIELGKLCNNSFGGDQGGEEWNQSNQANTPPATRIPEIFGPIMYPTPRYSGVDFATDTRRWQILIRGRDRIFVDHQR